MNALSLKKKLQYTMIAALAFTATACTSMGTDESDPWEPINRGMYKISEAIDAIVLRPVTYVYRGVMPDRGQRMVHNFVLNLQEPVVFGNSLLQGDPQNTFTSLWRFLLNSTVGIGGLFDVASEVGLIERRTDFGQTLALYGVESGPYLYLPILGPSSGRDGIGRIADAFMHPAMYIDDSGTSIALWAVTAVDTRSQNWDLIADVKKSSLDPYVTFRSGYKQRRANDIKKAREARNKAWKQAREAK